MNFRLQLFIVLLVFSLNLNAEKSKNKSGYSDAKCVSGNCINGNGILEFEDGMKIECNKFINGKFNGICKVSKNDGSWNESVCKNGEFLYPIRVYARDGWLCEGKWYEEKPGMVTCKNDDGREYKGLQLKSRFHGNGEMIFSDGGKYSGNWDQGYPHGKGTFIWSNKEKYVGDWKNGKQDGLGTLYDADEKIINKGKWSKGEFVSE
ncbi:MAG: hypothetical protein KDK36_16140 [Leptospiraceae bacterium]|nr:hypothetical protein [Leptospiraceae bacterium]